MTPAMRDKIERLLAHHDNMTIATIRPDGYPQATTVDRDHNNWFEIEGLSLAGTAERVTDAGELAKAGEPFVAKFPQIADFSEKDLAVMAIYRVTPLVFSVLDYTLGFGHSDFVTV